MSLWWINHHSHVLVSDIQAMNAFVIIPNHSVTPFDPYKSPGLCRRYQCPSHSDASPTLSRRTGRGLLRMGLTPSRMYTHPDTVSSRFFSSSHASVMQRPPDHQISFAKLKHPLDLCDSSHCQLVPVKPRVPMCHFLAKLIASYSSV